jgi:hypothetical protein
MKRLIVGIVLALVVVSGCVAVGLAKDDAGRVVYNRNGNALILFGGPKENSPSLSSFQSLSTRTASAAAMFPVHSMSDYDAQSYGNGFVRTEFDTHVIYGTDYLVTVWREVDGESETFWAGTSPQYNSSKIKLAESWKFGGIAITVSLPGGVGFSGVGSTIKWSGSDNSGNHWRMGHIYSGLYAQSHVCMLNVRQSSEGSHYFSTVGEWVSTMATKSS